MPASTPGPASSPVIIPASGSSPSAVHPSSGSQYSAASHTPAISKKRHDAPSQTPVAHGAAGVHSTSAEHSPPTHDVGSVPSAQRGSTQRPPRHSVAPGASPAPGHTTPRQSRVSTTVTITLPRTSTTTERSITTEP